MLKETPRNIQSTKIRTININKKEYVVAYDEKNNVIYSPVGNTNLDSVSRMISEEKQQIQEGNLIAKAKYNSIQAALESFGEEIEPIINL